MHRLLLLLSLCLLPLATPAQAQTVRVEDPWSRATAPGRPGVIYLNLSGGPDRLVGVTSDAGGMTELHETIVENGITRMRPIGGVLISPGTRTRLAPGGMHIMLMGLKKPLKQGDTIKLTLAFERARPLIIDVPVLASRAIGPHDEAHGGTPTGHGMPAR
jgi:copper(I)-binding protein